MPGLSIVADIPGAIVAGEWSDRGICMLLTHASIVTGDMLTILPTSVSCNDAIAMHQFTQHVPSIIAFIFYQPLFILVRILKQLPNSQGQQAGRLLTRGGVIVEVSISVCDVNLEKLRNHDRDGRPMSVAKQATRHHGRAQAIQYCLSAELI